MQNRDKECEARHPNDLAPVHAFNGLVSAVLFPGSSQVLVLHLPLSLGLSSHCPLLLGHPPPPTLSQTIRVSLLPKVPDEAWPLSACTPGPPFNLGSKWICHRQCLVQVLKKAGARMELNVQGF